jgi:hypothetical protein
MDPDLKAREALSSMIRSEGYKGAITVSRNETIVFPAQGPRRESLIFFEVTEGGKVIDPPKETVWNVVSHPKVWKAFVDIHTFTVYRMFGFPSGNDYSELAHRLKMPANTREAGWLAEGYVELVYGERSKQLTSEFEARRFVEDELANVLDPENMESIVSAFLEKHRTRITDALSKSGVTAGNEGYIVECVLGKAKRPLGIEPQVEVRAVRLRIDREGRITVKRDELLASVEAPLED